MEPDKNILTALSVVLEAIGVMETPRASDLPDDALLRRPAAAAYVRERIGLGTPATLRLWAVQGRGPPFRCVTGTRAIVYAKSDIDAWIESRLSERRVSSRSDAPSVEPLDGDRAAGCSDLRTHYLPDAEILHLEGRRPETQDSS